MYGVSSLFLYKFLFTFDLLLAEGLFLFSMERRSHFALRCSLCLTAGLLIVAGFPLLYYNALYSSLMFFLFFLLSILGIHLCFRISWSSCVFCAMAGYGTQHLASVLNDLLITVSGYDQAAQIYSSSPAQFSWYELLIFLEVYALVYWTIYQLLGSRIKRSNDISIRSPFLLLLMVLILLVEILLNAIVVYQKYEQLNFLYYFAATLTNLICTLSVLVIQFNLLLQKSLQTELGIVSQMWHQEQKQFQLSKETIDLINLKCHDMKHQIHSISQQAAISPSTLREIESTIEIYDSLMKTGNQALDIILAEKSLLCKKHQICISCIADGAKLNFMGDSDIYSLFGNLLDNAIRAVLQLEPDMRIIGLIIRAEGALLSINSNNYYSGEVRMVEGLPVTSQPDKSYHGFGTKSMVMIVEKYGGTIKFDAKNQVFNINILFPLSDGEAPDTGGRP